MEKERGRGRQDKSSPQMGIARRQLLKKTNENQSTRLRTLTVRIWGSFYDVKKTHVGNVVCVNFRFQYNNEGLSVHLY